MPVDLENLAFEYRSPAGPRKIFKDVTMSFAPGRFYALMGPSGSGKTTLFRLLTKELEPTFGSLSIDGRQLASIPTRELRGQLVGRIFQDYLLIPFLSPVENILLAGEISRGKVGQADRARAEELLDRVGIPIEDRAVESLSGGEQQRVAIARALSGSANVLLADEPTGALDARNTEEIASLLVDLAHEESITVIAGTHDQSFAEHADEVVRIADHGLIHG